MSSITLAFLGDIMLGRLVNKFYGKQAPDVFWGSAWPILTKADAVIANLECAITTHKQQWRRTPKVFYFGADPAAIQVLRAGNVRYVSLANNHILDFEERGLFDTLSYLDQARIAHAGAGRNLAEAMQPALLTVAKGTPGEIKVGILSLTDNEPPFAARPDKPGTWHTPINAERETLAPIRERIAHLKENNAGLVILSAHWGPNMIQHPPPHFQDFATAVADMGVNIFHGHSAHLFQGVAVRNKNLILYDTGDFIDDYAVDPVLRNDWSFIFLVQADNAGLIGLEMLPVRLTLAQVNLATGAEFEAICHRMKKLSAALGTALENTSRGLELKIR